MAWISDSLFRAGDSRAGLLAPLPLSMMIVQPANVLRRFLLLVQSRPSKKHLTCSHASSLSGAVDSRQPKARHCMGKNSIQLPQKCPVRTSGAATHENHSPCRRNDRPTPVLALGTAQRLPCSPSRTVSTKKRTKRQVEVPYMLRLMAHQICRLLHFYTSRPLPLRPVLCLISSLSIIFVEVIQYCHLLAGSIYVQLLLFHNLELQTPHRWSI